MAATVGQPSASLTEYKGLRDPSVLDDLRQQMEQEPFRFHFFQAVRLLQRMDPSRKPVGYFVPPQGEAIRFTSKPSLAFAPSEICAYKKDEEGQVHLQVEFMGLSASLSVLPAAYTEYLLERRRHKDFAMEEFFNIFNHRMLALFYRGWEKYRYYIAYERDGEDKVSERLFDLLGLGIEGLRGRTEVPDRYLLNYLSGLARHVRSALSLEQILAEYFEVPVKVRQFVGAWHQLPPENYTVLSGEGGDNERLGRGAVAGDEVWDQHGRIGVDLGPMPLRRYLEFLPGSAAHRDLVAWLRFYLNGGCETEVRLILDRSEVPSCSLGASDERRPQLGLVSWLKTKPLERDPGDAMYLVE